MSKVLIVYYSRTGNTKKMAEAVTEGIKEFQGAEVELKYYATPEELADFDALVIGIPTYHHDMTADIKNLFEETAVKNISLKIKLEPPLGLMVGVGKRRGLFLKS